MYIAVTLVQVCQCDVDGQGHGQRVVFLVLQKAASGALNRLIQAIFIDGLWLGGLAYFFCGASVYTDKV